MLIATQKRAVLTGLFFSPDRCPKAMRNPPKSSSKHRVLCAQLGDAGNTSSFSREDVMSETFTLGIGGAAGQGVATPGDIFALIFSRRGLHLNAYNAYQSIIRGGHTFLTIHAGADPGERMGDGIHLLIPLKQDTVSRHLRLLTASGARTVTHESPH